MMEEFRQIAVESYYIGIAIGILIGLISGYIIGILSKGEIDD